MSEIEKYQPPKPEGWFGHLSIEDKEFDLTRYNTTVWTHLGRLAIYDHVYVKIRTDEGEDKGVYLFEQVPSLKEAYDIVGPAALANGAQGFINMHEVVESDMEAFQKILIEDTNDFMSKPTDVDLEIPDDWLK